MLRTTGDEDLALRIFLAVPGGIYAPYESAAESFPTSPSADDLYFTARATGWYPLVVYRTDGTEATAPSKEEKDKDASENSDSKPRATPHGYEEPRPEPQEQPSDSFAHEQERSTGVSGHTGNT